MRIVMMKIEVGSEFGESVDVDGEREQGGKEE